LVLRLKTVSRFTVFELLCSFVLGERQKMKQKNITAKFTTRDKIGLVCAGRCIVKNPRRGTQAHLFGVKSGWRIDKIDSFQIPETISTELIGECISRVQSKKKEFEIRFLVNYMDTVPKEERGEAFADVIVEVLVMNGKFRGQWIPGRIVKQNNGHGIYDVQIAEDLPEHLSDYSGVLVPNVPNECVRPHNPMTRRKSKKKKKISPFARFEDETPENSSSSSSNTNSTSQNMSKDLEKIKIEMDDRRYAERIVRNEQKRERVRTESIAHERAKWMKDEDLSHCPYCERPWDDVLLWRHHCRACGTLVCDDCSGNVADVIGYSEKERVCDECFTNLSNIEGIEAENKKLAAIEKLGLGFDKLSIRAVLRRCNGDVNTATEALLFNLQQKDSTTNTSTTSTASEDAV